MTQRRPLDALGSIKVKLGVLVAASIVTATVVAAIGTRNGVSGWISAPVTLVAALALTQWLARGMVSPLLEMTSAASAMAGGDYGQRVTATSQDEVGELARAFNTMAGDLADADAQRRALIATVSHELRTPLTVQRALLENLVDGVIRPDDEQLSAALAQSQRLGDLVADLLDLSRVDTGVRDLRLTRVDVARLLRRAIAEAEVAGRSVSHLLSVEPEDLVVLVDEARLAQLVVNLLDNANRHSPPEGQVRLIARAGDAPGDSWSLEVVDEGPGIPADRVDAVFRRFGGGDDSAGGTGLGLAIAQWVVQLHGGRIQVVPTPPGQRGAHLRVDLPVEPASRATTLSISMTSTTALMSAPLLASAPSSKENMTATTAPPPTHPPVSGPLHRASAPAQPGTAIAMVGRAQGSFVDAMFGPVWPENDSRPRPRLVLGALGIGALAAVVVPYRSVGVGMFVMLLAAAAVIHAPVRRRRSTWFLTCLAVCVALASLVVLRADVTLGFLGVLTAAVLTASNLVSARSVTAVALAPACWTAAGVRGLPLLARTLAAARRLSGIYPVLRTAGISLVALVLFGGLFASGDAIFGSWVSALIPDLGWSELIVRSFTGFVVAGITLTGAYLALNPPRIGDLSVPLGSPLRRRYEWLTPLLVVSSVFLLFHIAQATAMWGGHDYVQRTAGLTYAQYVHQGFGQLTVATLLTLLAVGLAIRAAAGASSKDTSALRAAVTLQGVLTLGVVASALFRMAAYQEAYGYSTMRVFVDGFEAWLGLLVVLAVLAAWLPRSRAWSARSALMSGALLVLAYGMMNPAAWVANQNIDRFEAGRPLDGAYLSALGPDADHVIAQRLAPTDARCILGASSTPVIEDPLAWNLGRARAIDARRTLVVETYREVPANCERIMHSEHVP